MGFSISQSKMAKMCGLSVFCRCTLPPHHPKCGWNFQGFARVVLVFVLEVLVLKGFCSEVVALVLMELLVLKGRGWF